jgi:hypothetical protein
VPLGEFFNFCKKMSAGKKLESSQNVATTMPKKGTNVAIMVVLMLASGYGTESPQAPEQQQNKTETVASLMRRILGVDPTRPQLVFIVAQMKGFGIHPTREHKRIRQKLVDDLEGNREQIFAILRTTEGQRALINAFFAALKHPTTSFLSTRSKQSTPSAASLEDQASISFFLNKK